MRMVSEGDTEDWSDDAKNSDLLFNEICYKLHFTASILCKL